MNLYYSDAKKLAINVVELAIRDVMRGSDEARTWLRSSEAEMWINTAGFDFEAIKGKINSFCDHPKKVRLPKNKIKHRGYFEKLLGLSAN